MDYTSVTRDKNWVNLKYYLHPFGLHVSEKNNKRSAGTFCEKNSETLFSLIQVSR